MARRCANTPDPAKEGLVPMQSHPTTVTCPNCDTVFERPHSSPSQLLAEFLSRPFEWTPARETAALLIAEDLLTDEKIADTVGKSRKQVFRWSKHPAFKSRVAEHRKVFGPNVRVVTSPKRKKQPITPAIRWKVWKRDGFACHYCGTQMHLSIDHIVPEFRGGTSDLSNLVTACRNCNSLKGTSDYATFKARLTG